MCQLVLNQLYSLGGVAVLAPAFNPITLQSVLVVPVGLRAFKAVVFLIWASNSFYQCFFFKSVWNLKWVKVRMRKAFVLVSSQKLGKIILFLKKEL